MFRLHACHRLIAGAILTGWLSPTLASAPAQGSVDAQPVVTTTTITDADDTAGALDLSAVSHAVRENGTDASVRFTVRLHAPIEVSTLHRRRRLIVAELDTDGASGAERNITVYARRGQVHADLISNATRAVLARLRVRQVRDDAVRVRGPRRLIGARRIFWYSLYHRAGHRSCGRDDGFPLTCSDSVPDDGWLRLTPATWPTRYAHGPRAGRPVRTTRLDRAPRSARWVARRRARVGPRLTGTRADGAAAPSAGRACQREHH